MPLRSRSRCSSVNDLPYVTTADLVAHLRDEEPSHHTCAQAADALEAAGATIVRVRALLTEWSDETHPWCHPAVAKMLLVLADERRP